MWYGDEQRRSGRTGDGRQRLGVATVVLSAAATGKRAGLDAGIGDGVGHRCSRIPSTGSILVEVLKRRRRASRLGGEQQL
ncbi:hypothetical protein M0R45_024946 [Rubus argutus]|uniref:Uncharacterized protein n=1 Tax=Rubus argutus TaxID=59490 RepID=A0AAW1WVN8_RUBAR